MTISTWILPHESKLWINIFSLSQAEMFLLICLLPERRDDRQGHAEGRLRPRARQGLGVEVLVPGHKSPGPGHTSPGHTQPHQHLTKSLILPVCVDNVDSLVSMENVEMQVCCA